MLRHVLIFSGMVIAGVSAMTLTGSEQSPLAQVAEWYNKRQAPEATPVIAKVEVPERQVSTANRQYTLRANDRGHFEGDFRINGRTIHAMVDTGATTVAINSTVARSIGVRLAASDFRYEVRTANGLAKAAAIRIDSMEIGRIYVSGIEALVLEDHALQGVLVGMSFLKRLRRYEAEGDRLILTQ